MVKLAWEEISCTGRANYAGDGNLAVAGIAGEGCTAKVSLCLLYIQAGIAFLVRIFILGRCNLAGCGKIY